MHRCLMRRAHPLCRIRAFNQGPRSLGVTAVKRETPKAFRRLYRRGHTRSHLELGSQALRSRWYCMGNLCGRVGRRRANSLAKSVRAGFKRAALHHEATGSESRLGARFRFVSARCAQRFARAAPRASAVVRKARPSCTLPARKSLHVPPSARDGRAGKARPSCTLPARNSWHAPPRAAIRRRQPCMGQAPDDVHVKRAVGSKRLPMRRRERQVPVKNRDAGELAAHAGRRDAGVSRPKSFVRSRAGRCATSRCRGRVRRRVVCAPRR